MKRDRSREWKKGEKGTQKPRTRGKEVPKSQETGEEKE